MWRRHSTAFVFGLLLLSRVADGGETLIVRPRFDDSRSPHFSFPFHRELQRPRVALVLSGGGARGVSQIGVLRVLERHHIPVDFIAAASMGAIVGGLYASGYTVAEIESLALRTPWDDVLSLSTDTRRTEMFVDQKLAGDRSFIAVRFQGLSPVIPSAVSSGQRLTDFLNTQTLQALYHPFPDFDHLKIPFRAVATDLVSGRRAVLADGSLAEALRASATVPLLFRPIEKDSMQLVDGGLVSNIPVDLARDGGYDLVIVVNTTSGLRTPDEMKAPWQIADQIMGIMMNMVNERQLAGADVVISPEAGRHLSSDFHGLDTLIHAGEVATEKCLPEITSLYAARMAARGGDRRPINGAHLPLTVRFDGGSVADSLRVSILAASARDTSVEDVRAQVEALYRTALYRDVYAEITTDSASRTLRFVLTPNPTIAAVRFQGSRLVPDSSLTGNVARLLCKPLNGDSVEAALEGVVRVYRGLGYSLARIDTVIFDQHDSSLTIRLNEGIIHSVGVKGGDRTRDSFVLREFPLEAGDVFQIDRARIGVTNISSTTLFEFVYLEVAYEDRKPVISIRLKERPTQLVRFGMRADNERSLQGLIDIRDENFQGSGMDLGLTVAGGQRNLDALLEYKARRLFDSYLTFGIGGFYRSLDSYLYADAPLNEPNRWRRDRVGEYRDIRYGASLSFGGQLERLGKATIELLLQNVRVKSLDHADALEESYRLSTIRLGTIVDTRDRYPFPLDGVGLNLSYEFAFAALGSDIAYNSLRVMYETYTTWGTRHTLHPRFTMGFADKTMPFAQQFRLGGRESFFGLREDDRRGRQLLLLNLEYRYFLPFRILFDAYLKARYDLGTISEVPEEIKFSTLKHGLGVELALDTPVGQASFGVGKSYFFIRDLPQNPVQEGPLLFYFMIGYQP
jgi:NTE family protein